MLFVGHIIRIAKKMKERQLLEDASMTEESLCLQATTIFHLGKIHPNHVCVYIFKTHCPHV